MFVFTVPADQIAKVRYLLRPAGGTAYWSTPTQVSRNIEDVGPDEVEVSLYHCGVNPLTYRGERYEVVDPPFDATNAPPTFSGVGTVTRQRLELHYRDRAGATLVFTPDDASRGEVCA